jgi:catechol 2,3-dioxygenase-like lactoylglutathione lyase family enzyme
MQVNVKYLVSLFSQTNHKHMEHKAISIRPFIGAKDFELSRSFYRDLGFHETVLTPNMSVFETDKIAFYLQDAYVKDWVDNTMIFLEVEDVDRYWKEIMALDLTAKYKDAKLVPVRIEPWGKECFLHDPSGILWHFGEFFRVG